MSESSISNRSPTKVDEAASAACIRSGAFALLLSLALILLIPYWIDRPRFAALGAYVAARFNLASSLDSLDDDPVWKDYRATDPNAESLSLRQLHNLQVALPASGAAPEPPGKSDRPSGNVQGRAPSRVPRPPVGVKASTIMEIPETDRIADAIVQLNDPETLTSSRQVSNFFSFSIARWANKRNALVYQHVLANPFAPCAKELEVRAPKKLPGPISSLMYAYRPPEFVPALTQEALLNCLTVRDLRELARLEQPAVSNPMELGGRIGPTIELTPGSLPKGAISLMAATLALHVLLFFALMYFGAFVREAASSPGFPAPGTLFGAFSRSRSSLAVLCVALWTPL
jgi:hypothetical protein